MNNITTQTQLKIAIHELEIKQGVEWMMLKTELNLMSKRLTPSNIIKHSLLDFVSAIGHKENLMGTVMGLGAASLTKSLTRNNGSGGLGTIAKLLMPVEAFYLVSRNSGKILPAVFRLIKLFAK